MELIRSARQKYKDFFKVNKGIADYIPKDPTRLLSLTTNETTSNSETSPASVTRFSKQLGSDGWEELKLSIAAVQAAGNGRKDTDPIVAADDSVDTICMKVEFLLNAMIEDLFYTVDKQALERAIAHVKKVEKIRSVGIGVSSSTTYNLYHKLSRAGRQVTFDHDSHVMLEFLNYVAAQDTLITVSYGGLTKEALIICEVAKNGGTTVIFIISNDGGNVRSLSNEVFLVPNNEHFIRVGAISSIALPMAIGDVLYLGPTQDDLGTEIERNMIETS